MPSKHLAMNGEVMGAVLKSGRGLELVGNLDDPDYNLMRITFLINKAEFYHRIVAPDVTLNINNLVALNMFLQLLLENMQCICKINF